jgi:hypothetical protein
MSIQGNLETSGPPLSTADLAAAGRRPNPPTADKSNEIISQSSDAIETQQQPSRRNLEPTVSADDETPSPERELDVSGGDIDASRPEPATKPRSVRDADTRGRVGAVNERGSPPAAAQSPVTFAEALEPLFTPELAQTYRSRWGAIQSGFVDDPRRAVRSGDELVAQIMTNLANSFAEERHRVEAQLDDSGDGPTENLRVALRRYRSFFERLLSL